MWSLCLPAAFLSNTGMNVTQVFFHMFLGLSDKWDVFHDPVHKMIP